MKPSHLFKNHLFQLFILAFSACSMYGMNNNIEIKENDPEQEKINDDINNFVKDFKKFRNGKGTLLQILCNEKDSLHLAVENKNLETFLFSLLTTINLTSLDINDHTALDITVKQNSRLRTFILGSLGVDIDEKAVIYAQDPEIKKYLEDTTYEMQFTKADWEATKNLELTAPEDWKDQNGNNVYHLLATRGFSVPKGFDEDPTPETFLKENNDGDSPLIIYVKANNIQAVKQCFTHGINKYWTGGKSMACARTFDMRKIIAAAKLISRKNSYAFEDVDDTVSHQPYTELSGEILKKIIYGEQNQAAKLEQLKEALKSPLDLDAPINKFKKTALLIAAEKRYLNIASCLIENGATIDANRFFDVIDLNNNNIDIIDFLFKHGVRLPTGSRQYDMFRGLIRENNLKMIKLFIKNGGDLKSYNEDYTETLLELALKLIDNKSDSRIAKYFLKKGIDIEEKDYKNRTPYQYALEHKLPKAAEWCIKHGAKVNKEPKITGLNQKGPMKISTEN